MWLSLASNLSYDQQFTRDTMADLLRGLKEFIQSNQRQLQHLDLSELANGLCQQTKLDAAVSLMSEVMATSKSLQVIHFDGWNLDTETQARLAVKLNIKYLPVSNPAFFDKELKGIIDNRFRPKKLWEHL